MAARSLVCGLPASGVKPQIRQQPREQADEDQRSDADFDLQEIIELEYKRSVTHLGYLIRIEEEGEDIDPLFKEKTGRKMNVNDRKKKKESPPEPRLFEEELDG